MLDWLSGRSGRSGRSGENKKCTYCKRKMSKKGGPNHPLFPTKDHLEPKQNRSLGDCFPGIALKIKIPTVWCCRQCNQLKGDLHFNLWWLFMQIFPKWWEDSRFKRGTLTPEKVLNLFEDSKKQKQRTHNQKQKRKQLTKNNFLKASKEMKKETWRHK